MTNPMYGSVSEEPRGQVWLVGGCVRPPGESGGWFGRLGLARARAKPGRRWREGKRTP